MAFRGIVQFSLFTLSLAQPFGTSKLEWGPCNKTEVPSDVPVQCSTLLVPLDYTQPSPNETLILDLVKVPAPVKSSKGSILFNFGGPGGTGRDVIGNAQISEELLALTGREYDLISFDPRGTTGSRIPMQCYDNEFDAWTFLLDQRLSNSSEVELARLWTRGGMLADACLKTQNKTGSVITTAFVSRDMMSIVDALGEDGMLRYWGFSYGTTLGATVAAMFPDRIERMVLDGVQNVHEYYHAAADFEEFTDADKEFSALFSACAENREKCDLGAGNTKTAAELEQSVWDLIDAVKVQPLAVGSHIVDYSAVKGLITQFLYDSAAWPALAKILNLVLTGRKDELAPLLDALFPPDAASYLASVTQANSLAGIRCSDLSLRNPKFEDFAADMQRMYDTSRTLGEYLVLWYSACAQWKIEPKERYTGDFNVKTKNPVLFIGNTFDGLTPLVSAKNVSSTFEHSALLVVDGYGHASLAAPSACTIRTTSAYWADGTLPAEGKICESDAPLFSGVTWDDVIREVYGNSTVSKREVSRVPKIGGPLAPLFAPR
ncbi:hypothetical protein M426DRAFT_16190 [Hypoxylon sp. CI-4A]|nr:hypothetical protein M426DRAFT_16190 [Hypoxylon sp. CI-4A]